MMESLKGPKSQKQIGTGTETETGGTEQDAKSSESEEREAQRLLPLRRCHGLPFRRLRHHFETL